MASSSPQRITQLLVAWSKGDEAALGKLMPFVYNELRRIAHHYMQNERTSHTLQTTALIHEAYLRLGGYRRVNWRERAQFFAIAAQLMRRILVEYARAKQRVKRGGKGDLTYVDADSVSIQDPGASESYHLDVVALDKAMTRLEAIRPRQVRVVEMHFFAGMKTKEIAEILDVHINTVARDLDFAKAWLRRELAR